MKVVIKHEPRDYVLAKDLDPEKHIIVLKCSDAPGDWYKLSKAGGGLYSFISLERPNTAWDGKNAMVFDKKMEQALQYLDNVEVEAFHSLKDYVEMLHKGVIG